MPVRPWGAASLFGPQAGVLLGWAAGLGTAVYLMHSLTGSPGVHHDEAASRFDVPGSAWPLALMLTAFAVRYGAVVTLVLHPDWAMDRTFAAGASLVHGTLSGLPAARALSILRQARPALRAVPSLAC